MDHIQEKVIRHDEQIGAMREELRSGFDRLEAAFKAHAVEDTLAHTKTDQLAEDIRVNAKASRKMWGVITAGSAAGSGIITGLYHFWSIAAAHAAR
jgi:hypothetical protein